MQEILNIYSNLYLATGRYIEYQKTSCYAWIWKWRRGKKHIQNINIDIFINQSKITQLQIEQSARTLGVHLSPALKWDD